MCATHHHVDGRLEQRIGLRAPTTITMSGISTYSCMTDSRGPWVEEQAAAWLKARRPTNLSRAGRYKTGVRLGSGGRWCGGGGGGGGGVRRVGRGQGQGGRGLGLDLRPPTATPAGLLLHRSHKSTLELESNGESNSGASPGRSKAGDLGPDGRPHSRRGRRLQPHQLLLALVSRMPMTAPPTTAPTTAMTTTPRHQGTPRAPVLLGAGSVMMANAGCRRRAGVRTDLGQQPHTDMD